jgi:hypothetical protein
MLFTVALRAQMKHIEIAVAVVGGEIEMRSPSKR